MSTFYQRSFFVLTAAILGFAVWQILAPFWGALAWSIVLAVLLAPLQDRLLTRFGNRPALAAALLTLLTPVVVFLPLALLGASFVEQGRALVYALQHSSWRIDATLVDRIEEYPLIGPVVAQVTDMLDLEATEITGFMISIGQTLLRYAANLGSQLVLGALNTTLAFMLMLFLLFFMLRDGRRLLQRVGHLLPIDALHREQLFTLLASTTRAVVYGSGLTALLQGALTAIGFALTGLPSPVVFGVLATLFSLLPAGGTAFVWLPAALALAGMGRSGAALFMLAWGAFISVVDNFLRPVLVSAQAHVSTLAVFMGVIGGAAAFGGIGLIIGPVLLTLASALLRFIEEKRLGQDPESR
ncbi:MAG: AI-2E family transporter [Gammaproteobacteria bacterium]|nr:AI-2E family transporter [Gammaproteobacteria bacterium]